jgi:hypothetical protein
MMPLTEPAYREMKKASVTMRHRQVTGKRLKWPAMLALLGGLILISAVPGEARVRVFISPSIVVCNAQLCRPTASSCRPTPWNHLAPTLAQGPGAPRVGAGPVPPTQHRTSKTHVEPVSRYGSSDETRIMGA